MNVQELIQNINKKQEDLNQTFSEEGLERLQETARIYAGEDKLVYATDLLEEIKKRPKKSLFLTGLSSLDNLIGGFREQQLISIFAHSKHGKTQMGLALQGLMINTNPVMIPLEQSNEELVEQLHENGYDIPNFLSPRRNATDVTVDWIEQRVVEGIAKYNTKMVVIDHLGYIDNHGTKGKYARENLAYRIGQVMRELKTVAKKWKVVIVLLVHISQSDESKPPTLQDIGNSSDILKESDMAISLWRKNTKKGKITLYENKTLVSVLANRRTGKNGNIGLLFDNETGKYTQDDGWVKSMEEMAEDSKNAEEFFDEQ